MVHVKKCTCEYGRGVPTTEFYIYGKPQIYCSGWLDKMNDEPLVVCRYCLDFASGEQPQKDLEAAKHNCRPASGTTSGSGSAPMATASIALIALRTQREAASIGRKRTMTDQEIIDVLWRDGYHAAARLLEDLLQKLKAADEAVVSEVVETNIYDIEEIHENCTVQVLRNSLTGEVSVGWWENEEV